MSDINLQRLPKHVAIIMDGNGRWARERNLSRTQGHAEGVKRVEEIVWVANRLGIKVLTLFTFSTENWRRPETEVSLLMDMLMSALSKKIDNLHKNNIRFQTIGRTEGIPKNLLKTLVESTEKTKKNTGLIVNLAFNYGSRGEILDAFQEILEKINKGQLQTDKITEETISQHLYTRNLPDPDLLIRTSGEQRISNFLLWQLSYAEFYFVDTFWPDFNETEFKKAIVEYQNRERRYGKISAEE